MDVWAKTTDHELIISTLVVLLIIVVLRKPLANLAMRGLLWVMSTLSIELSTDVQNEIVKVLRVVIVTGSALLLIDSLDLPKLFGGVVERVLISVLVLAVFAAWYRLVPPFVALIDPNQLSKLTADVSWLARIAQFIIVVLAVTAVLEVWDIDISSALTGVGVFGAGLAIAAQDLIRNLFGAMSNMSEKRFQPGDWVAIEGGVEGIVTKVDLRSTTIQDFDLVPQFVPNVDLANSVVLNKSKMTHRKVYWTIRLVLEASDTQIEQVCKDLEAYLHDCGDFLDDGSQLLFVIPTGLTSDAVEILVFGFTKTKDYKPYLEACAGLTLAIRKAVRDAGTELAYPTQAIVKKE